MPRSNIARWLAAGALLLALLPLQAEIRAIWALPWGLETPARIDSFLSAAAAARVTDVLVEVRYRADALYQTNRVPDNYPNPEPRSHILKDASFDPLAYTLAQGHKRDLRVHAWFVTFNAAPQNTLLLKANYIYQHHPGWFTRAQKSPDPKDAAQFGYFLDPGLPEVQDYLLNVLGDLLSGYPELDGLHLDYVRYPGSKQGYHPDAVARFDARSEPKLSWNQWRMQQVTDFVARTRALADSLNPGLVFSAAVIPEYHQALDLYAQDWHNWLLLGLVDFVYPMVYDLELAEFSAQLGALGKLRHPEGMVVGIRAWNDDGSSLLPSSKKTSYSVNDVEERITAIRKQGFAGHSLFSYNGLLPGNALARLATSAYADSILAAQIYSPYQPSHQGRDRFAAYVSLQAAGRFYQLDLLIPQAGTWQLEVRDIQGRVFYQRDNYYLQGYSQDSWNGVLETGEILAPGSYIVSLLREGDGYRYLIPVFLEALQI